MVLPSVVRGPVGQFDRSGSIRQSEQLINHHMQIWHFSLITESLSPANSKTSLSDEAAEASRFPSEETGLFFTTNEMKFSPCYTDHAV